MKICELSLPAMHRLYGKDSLAMATKLLAKLKIAEYDGVYLASLWLDGGYNNGLDVVSYTVNPKYGAEVQFSALVSRAHELGLEVGVDVVPHYVSDLNILAQNCLDGDFGFKDCLYVVSKEEAERLTEAGVPNLSGRYAYSRIGDKYVRSTFIDYYQLDLNWNSKKVQEYFRQVFRYLWLNRIDFAKIDSGTMLLEDVSKANPEKPFAVYSPKKSVEAIRKVAGGMKLCFECFDPNNIHIFDDMPDCFIIDSSDSTKNFSQEVYVF